MKKRIKKYFVPHKENNHAPEFFKNTVTGVMIALVFGFFVFSTYIQDIVSYVSKNSQLAAVVPGVLIELTNKERAAGALSTLQENELLNQSATKKAQDMAEREYFAHVGPDGKKPWNWLQDVGYQYQYAGENLAINFSDSEDVTRAWMNSPTHKANIVKAEYSEIGTGVATGTYSGKKTTYIAQVYARPYVASPSPVAPQYANAWSVIESYVEKGIAFVVLEHYQVTFSILSALFIIVLVALIIAIGVKIRIQHMHVVRNGFILFIVIGVLLYITHAMQSRNTRLPGIESTMMEYSVDDVR